MLKRPDLLQSAAIINADDTSPHQITNGMRGVGSSLGWSPDGKSLLIYARPVGARNIYRLLAGDLLVVVAEGVAQTEARRVCSRPDDELSP